MNEMNKITKFSDDKKIWLCSDTHYGHANICRGTTSWPDGSKTRDFDTIEQMNDQIVNNINNVVGQDDILIHAGDFSFGGFEKIIEFRNRIVCQNVHLILGNHDHHIEKNKEDVQKLFSSVSETMILERKFNEKTRVFFISHLPVASWPNMGKGVFHLHGHTHLPKHLRVSDGRYMDIGIDGNDLKPMLLDDVFGILKNKQIKNLVLPEDHHI